GRHAVARDVDALTVDQDMTVACQLATLTAADGEAETVDDVVETALDEAEHLFARGTTEMASRRVVGSELTLEQTIDATHLLLLTQTEAVLAELDATLAVLSGRVRTPRHGALLGEAALPLQVELAAFATAELANGSKI